MVSKLPVFLNCLYAWEIFLSPSLLDISTAMHYFAWLNDRLITWHSACRCSLMQMSLDLIQFSFISPPMLISPPLCSVVSPTHDGDHKNTRPLSPDHSGVWVWSPRGWEVWWLCHCGHGAPGGQHVQSEVRLTYCIISSSYICLLQPDDSDGDDPGYDLPPGRSRRSWWPSQLWEVHPASLPRPRPGSLPSFPNGEYLCWGPGILSFKI